MSIVLTDVLEEVIVVVIVTIGKQNTFFAHQWRHATAVNKVNRVDRKKWLHPLNSMIDFKFQSNGFIPGCEGTVIEYDYWCRMTCKLYLVLFLCCCFWLFYIYLLTFLQWNKVKTISNCFMSEKDNNEDDSTRDLSPKVKGESYLRCDHVLCIQATTMKITSFWSSRIAVFYRMLYLSCILVQTSFF